MAGNDRIVERLHILVTELEHYPFDLDADDTEAIRLAISRIEELEGALRPYVFGDPTLEQILWGDQPDDAPMQITVPLGAHRAARAVLTKDQGNG